MFVICAKERRREPAEHPRNREAIGSYRLNGVIVRTSSERTQPRYARNKRMDRK